MKLSKRLFVSQILLMLNFNQILGMENVTEVQKDKVTQRVSFLCKICKEKDLGFEFKTFVDLHSHLRQKHIRTFHCEFCVDTVANANIRHILVECNGGYAIDKCFWCKSFSTEPGHIELSHKKFLQKDGLFKCPKCSFTSSPKELPFINNHMKQCGVVPVEEPLCLENAPVQGTQAGTEEYKKKEVLEGRSKTLSDILSSFNDLPDNIKKILADVATIS